MTNDSTLTPTDCRMMAAALAEARRALDLGEIPIGAVVASGDKIIGRGHNMTEALGDVDRPCRNDSADLGRQHHGREIPARLHALRDCGAVHHVCRSYRMEPDRTHCLRCGRSETRLHFLHAAAAAVSPCAPW